MKMAYRILGVLLAVAAVTGGMVGGWYAWENYKGNRLWEQTRRELEAKGEVLDAKAFIPPMVADDQNLAFAPLFVRLYQYKVDPATGLVTFQRAGSTHVSETMDALPYGKAGVGQKIRPSLPNWISGHALDLAALQQYYRARPDFPRSPQPQTPAEDVRLALTRFDPLLDELARAAAERPLGRFPVNWTQQPASMIYLPEDNMVQVFVSTLRLRATVFLALGRSEDALRDITMGLRLMRTCEAEPMLIANLVDVTCNALLMQPIWEGLAAHRWNAAQLATLQGELSRIDVIRDFAHSCRAERAIFMVPLIDDLERARNLSEIVNMMQMTGDPGASPRFLALLMHLFPGGWFAEAKVVTCRLDQRDILDVIRPDEHRILAQAVNAGAEEVSHLPVAASTLIARIVLPVSASVSVKIAGGQAFVDEAAVACALERYALEQGGYPETLDALVPGWINRVTPDVIDGAPMRYARTPEGSYRLWEVGWNGVDEGGKIVLETGSTKPDIRRGDWVWQYAVVPGTGDR